MSERQRRTVLITGASSGIGKVTALYLAGKGYSVIGTSRSLGRLDGLVREATDKGLAVKAIQLDINSGEGVQAALPRLIEESGGCINVLVNNAGYGLWGPVESLSVDELKAQFETNLFAVLRLIKAVLPGMVAGRSGTIVNVSSIAGRIGTPFNGAYCSSKFALEGLSEALRAELWPFGVRVAVVEPGLFRTGFQQNQLAAEMARSEELAYGPYIRRYDERHRRFDWLAHDPIKVAQVIHKVIRSRRPGFRYPVGSEARLGMLGARVLPERIFQTLLRRATMG